MGSIHQSLQDLVDNFTPGGCYGIEWRLSGDKLTQKSHYNPQWRIEGVKAKGLSGLYTEQSASYEFSVGQGFVGWVFEHQEVLFVEDLQKLHAEGIKDAIQSGDGEEFVRAGLAKEFDIHSAIFLPSSTGVFEIGSVAIMQSLPSYYAPHVYPSTPPVAAVDPAAREAMQEFVTGLEPPMLLRKLVDDLTCASCYGIEWVLIGDILQCRSHYNPAWRIEGVRRQGLKGLYTTKSAAYTFAVGEGLVGEAFAKQVVTFAKDLQSLRQEDIMTALQTGATEAYQRIDIAQEFGIHSAVFLPSADGVLEIGSTQQVESLEFLLTTSTWTAIAGKTLAADIVSALSTLAV
jgi:hypothetical protein